MKNAKSKMKKALAMLFSLIMVLGVICVPAMAADAADTAVEKEWYMLSDTPVFEQNFDVVNEDGTLGGDGGTYTLEEATALVSDGEFHLSTTTQNDRVYFEHGISAIYQKDQMVEFDVRTENNNGWYFYIGNASGNVKSNATVYTVITPSRGTISTYCESDGTQTSVGYSSDEIEDDRNFHIAVYLDYSNSVYSLWINNIQIASKVTFYNTLNASKLFIANNVKAANDIHIDNIKVTLPDITPCQSVDSDSKSFLLNFDTTLTPAEYLDTYKDATYSNFADMSITNGKLTITPTSAETRHFLKFGEKISSIPQNLVFEFDLTCTTVKNNYFYLGLSNDSSVLKSSNVCLQIAGTNQIKYYYNDSAFSEYVDMGTTLGTESHYVIALIPLENCKNNTSVVNNNQYKYSVWIDGKLILDEIEPRTAIDSTTDVKCLNIVTRANGTGAIIDNFKVYQAELDPKAAVAAAKATITGIDSIANYDSNSELASLKTALSGADGHGCKIGYISNGNFIRPAGTVNFPLIAATDTVTPVIYTRGYWEVLDPIAVDVPSVYSFGTDKVITPTASADGVTATIAAAAKSANAPAITTVTAVYDGTELVGINVNDAAVIFGGGFAVSAPAANAAGKSVKVFMLKDITAVTPLTGVYSGVAAQ